MDIKTFNFLSASEAAEIMRYCCTASRWVDQVVDSRPYSGIAELLAKAEERWAAMVETDWLEAFDGHPRIGDPESLKARFRTTLATASMEQFPVRQADEETLAGLADGNQAYFDRFGFIFIIFASGKSAPEMLMHLRSRLGNNRQTELAIAAAEQWKITRRRFDDVFAATCSHAIYGTLELHEPDHHTCT